ncbi:MAG: NAD(P)/FAD-dependent oxidoreductase [Bacillota bacterium]
MKTVAVIGGGAAGLMAAGQAALAGARAILFEKNDRLGKKLVITGKGRCNVTNDADLQTLIKNIPGNGQFLYSAMTRFGSTATQDFFTDLGVQLKVERGNRVFPASDRSFDIIDAFKKFLNEQGVELRLRSSIERVIAPNGSVTGLVTGGSEIPVDAVILCTGGASYPVTGSTGDGYRMARLLGHHVVDPRPSLVPLECTEEWPKSLQGLALKNVTLTLFQDGKELGSEFGEMLFTHFGITGPIVLSLSRLVTHRLSDKPIVAGINLKPALTVEQLDKRLQRDFAQNIRRQFKNALDELLPKRLISIVINESGIDPEKPVNQITKDERAELIRALTELSMTICSTRPLSEAIVTAGGVDVKEINPKTMESKLVKGLYFAGEVMDVDGYTGGFNLQAAFATGFVAGRSAAEWS